MKTKFLVLISIFTFYSASAQDILIEKKNQFYTRLYAGYSFRAGGGMNDQLTQNANGTTTISLTPFSYGKGLNISYGLGCMFNKNIGVELNLSSFLGGNNQEKNIYRVDANNDPYTISQTIKYSANLFRINPALVIATECKKIIPYAKLGFIVGWGNGYNKITESVNFLNSSSHASGDFGWDVSGGKAWGYTSSIGVNFKNINKRTSFFVELSHISMSGNFKKASLTKSIINGTNNLQNLSVSQKEVVFVDEIIQGVPQNSWEPTKVLKHKSSFDSIGFNIGIIIKSGRL